MTDFRSELAWLVETFESYSDTIFGDWTGVRGVDERLKAELERAKAILAMTDWQPIETAPKDDMQILAWNGERRAVVSWIDYYGFWEGKKDPLGEPCGIRPQPTHWMPLPDPPKD